MTNIRTYENIRLFRGKRKDEELNRLADAQQDFDFRRLFIAEREQDLHVTFSRKMVSNWMAWGFLTISLLLFQFSGLMFTLIGISCAMKIYSNRCHKQFKKIFKKYKNSLAVVDAVIQNDYGMSMPQ